MIASERFGPRCRNITLEKTTTGAVGLLLQVLTLVLNEDPDRVFANGERCSGTIRSGEGLFSLSREQVEESKAVS